jgi:hypothetical protein
MQYSKQLASILKKASEVVTGSEEMASDLATAAYALENMPQEKLAAFLDPEGLKKMFEEKAIVEGDTSIPFEHPYQEVSKEKSQWEKKPFFWSEKAADSVRQKLASMYASEKKEEESKEAACDDKAKKDTQEKEASLDASRPDAVAAAALPKEQTPDGSHNKGTDTKDVEKATGAKLTPEQTPNQAESLDSDMVAKSDAPVVKTASQKSTSGGTIKVAGVEMSFDTGIDGIALEASDKDELSSLFE